MFVQVLKKRRRHRIDITVINQRMIMRSPIKFISRTFIRRRVKKRPGAVERGHGFKFYKLELRSCISGNTPDKRKHDLFNMCWSGIDLKAPLTSDECDFAGYLFDTAELMEINRMRWNRDQISRHTPDVNKKQSYEETAHTPFPFSHQISNIKFKYLNIINNNLSINPAVNEIPFNPFVQQWPCETSQPMRPHARSNRKLKNYHASTIDKHPRAARHSGHGTNRTGRRIRTHQRKAGGCRHLFPRGKLVHAPLCRAAKSRHRRAESTTIALRRRGEMLAQSAGKDESGMERALRRAKKDRIQYLRVGVYEKPRHAGHQDAVCKPYLHRVCFTFTSKPLRLSAEAGKDSHHEPVRRKKGGRTAH